MRAWREYEAGLDAERVELHCVVCGAIDRPPLEDAVQDGEDDHRCLACVRAVETRRRLIAAIRSANGGRHVA